MAELWEVVSRIRSGSMPARISEDDVISASKKGAAIADSNHSVIADPFQRRKTRILMALRERDRLLNIEAYGVLYKDMVS